MEPGQWFTAAELLSDGASGLRRLFARTVAEDGVPEEVAAVALAGWHGGVLATHLGLELTLGVGVVVEPATLRFHHLDGGGVDAVDSTGGQLVVPIGHPWADELAVATVATFDEVLETTVAAMVSVLDPVLSVIPSIKRVGRVGLWNEVGDSLGMALCAQDELRPTVAAQGILDRAVRSTHRRWKATPTVRIVDGPAAPIAIGRKGGCCLLYRHEPEPIDPAVLDEVDRRFLERFPVERPDYCATCSLRTVADCEARQLYLDELTGRI